MANSLGAYGRRQLSFPGRCADAITAFLRRVGKESFRLTEFKLGYGDFYHDIILGFD
jgi:hypothetical protein